MKVWLLFLLIVALIALIVGGVVKLIRFISDCFETLFYTEGKSDG